eukprot:UN00962
MNSIPRMTRRTVSKIPNFSYYARRTYFANNKTTKMRSSLFGLPMGIGTWVGVYLPCTVYTLVFTQKFKKGDPIEYERNVRGRNV